MAKKYYRVTHNGAKEIMAGAEVALLQQSGSSIKILRKARPEELSPKESNG